MSFRLFSRAPLIDDRAARRRAPRRAASGSSARRAGTRRSASRCRPASSSAGVPWKITWPPCSPAPGPEVDHVVGRADRLLVVLDDDDGVAEVAQPRQRRRAARGCRAGAGRSTARRARRARRSGSSRSASPAGCAALRRPTASRRCGPASDSRRRRRPGSAAGRGSRAGCGWRSALSRSVSSRPSKTLHRLGDRQVDVLGDRPALDADRAALRLQALAAAQVGHGRSARYGSSSSCSTQVPSS